MDRKITAGTLDSPKISYSVTFITSTEIQNVSPHSGKTSNATDINTIEILDIYRERFNEAWKELADK